MDDAIIDACRTRQNFQAAAQAVWQLCCLKRKMAPEGAILQMYCCDTQYLLG